MVSLDDIWSACTDLERVKETSMKILIETIRHEDQRYDTCGDWTVSPTGNWHISVSSLHNWRREVLIAIHELIEMALCRHKGISTKDVDDFDVDYQRKLQHLAECNDGTACRDANHEQLRKETSAEEPGDSKLAPYYKQHQIATGIERLLAAELEVNWLEYEDQVSNLLWRQDDSIDSKT